MFRIVAALLVLQLKIATPTDCGLPAIPRHGLLNGQAQWDESWTFPPGTEMSYSCQGENRKLFGNMTTICSSSGTWGSTAPWCGTNVIYKKKLPVYISLSNGQYPLLLSRLLEGLTTMNSDSCLLLSQGETYTFVFRNQTMHRIHSIFFHVEGSLPDDNEIPFKLPAQWTYHAALPVIQISNDLLENVDDLEISPFASLSICRVEVYARISDFECGQPEIPANGRVLSIKKNNQYVEATYSCSEGYQLKGPVNIYCDGINWIGRKPICIPSTAGSHDGVTEVNILPTKRTRRSTTHAVNVHPIESNPSSNSELDISSCGFPGNPAYGLIDRKKINSTALYEVGSEVHYSCVENHFVLSDGNEVRTCLPDGTWSGLRPWCDSNIAFGTSATLIDSNGVKKVVPSVTDGMKVHLSDSECPSLNPTSHLLLERSKRFCAVQRVVIHFRGGRLEDYSLKIDEHSCHMKSQNDGILNFECLPPNHGYDTTSSDKCSKSIRFNHQGKNAVGICEVEVYQNPTGFECGEPEIPADGNSVVSLRGESVYVDYKCSGGYELRGDKRRICHGRHWHGKQPVCKPLGSLEPRSRHISTKTRIYRATETESIDLHPTEAFPKQEAPDSLWINLMTYVLVGCCLLVVAVLVVVFFLWLHRRRWCRRNTGHMYDSIKGSVTEQHPNKNCGLHVAFGK